MKVSNYVDVKLNCSGEFPVAVCHWLKPLQESPTASAAPALVSEVQGQNHGSHSPYPHCNLSAVRRNASAATSVEAVQQGGEDEDVQGGLAVASNHAGGSATSVPATSYSRRQQGPHHSSMPVALSSRQQSPAHNKATSAVPIERGHSVVYDSEFQHAPRSPGFQQHIGVPAAASGHKRQRTDSGTASPAHQQQAASLMLSPECSEASQGHVQVAQHHETCQAAPETTQQATIQEVSSVKEHGSSMLAKLVLVLVLAATTMAGYNVCGSFCSRFASLCSLLPAYLAPRRCRSRQQASMHTYLPLLLQQELLPYRSIAHASAGCIWTAV